jgi:hypothetical protein
MEYQKSTRHDTSQRPDIVYHIPKEVSGASVWENNFAVWALKHSASAAGAEEDFGKLDEMCVRLRYPLIVFLNVCSSKTRLDSYQGNYHQRIHAFAIPGPKGSTLRYSYFKKGKIVTEYYPVAKS